MHRMIAITTGSNGEQLAEEVERPMPGPTEVLIKAAAVGVNPVDWKTAHNEGVNGFFPEDQPMILGWDIAGEVVEIGAGVTRFSVGDRVFGMPQFPHPANAYAEYVVAGSRQVALIPDGVSDIDAGAVPLAGLTAWQAIVDTLKVGEGDKVLIHAASGGVGHLAVQIAKARGAEVWATASAPNHDKLRELGVDHPIDYRTEQFEDLTSGMDAVLDLVGTSDNATRSLKSLRRGGQLLVIPSSATVPDQAVLDKAGVTASWMLVEPDYPSLEALGAMMADGSLRVVLGETRPLDQMRELHEIGQAGGPFGKLVAIVR